MSENKGFSNLSSNECLSIYPEVVKNGDEYFSTAELLAKSGYYGKAIAFQILGTEEYIKALCLCLDGYEFGLRNNKVLNGLFKNHQPRHSILRDAYSVWMVIKPIYDLKRTSTKKGILNQLLTAGYKLFPAIANHEWWKNADQLKQRGFYVDYHDQVLSPALLTNADFEEAVNRTKPVAIEILELTQKLKLMTIAELDNFKKLFKVAKLPELLTETIKSRND